MELTGLLKCIFFFIEAEQSSLKYLNFLACGKIYRFLALPFGLKNSAAYYTLMVSKILKTLKPEIRSQVIHYLDDILIHSQDKERHAQVLAAVF